MYKYNVYNINNYNNKSNIKYVILFSGPFCKTGKLV